MVGTLEYLDVLKLQFVPFLVVSIVSTPLVYVATAWSVRLLMKLFHKRRMLPMIDTLTSTPFFGLGLSLLC